MNADYVWKLSKFGRLTSTRLRFDDDFADRLNYQFTGLLLFVFVGIIGIRQYVGKLIVCNMNFSEKYFLSLFTFINWFHKTNFKDRNKIHMGLTSTD
ncbi:uncharacterized protein DEA37_0004946 [Paragonimus westermani]|uniref:Innexin n=1 Tax=Paragonimus westermani TaxID=34504 RepID=A0A5J4P1Q7_9TREM|nr:uncharacterized protein DEA37_0004946 [Paragonimus westermani]